MDRADTAGFVMRLSKRQFLKLSLGGTAVLFLAPALPPGLLAARPVPLPSGYLEGVTHQLWMKLSFNRGAESRQTRRFLGAALRNIGIVRGQGRGSQAAPHFDRAIEEVFHDWIRTSRKPASLFGLIQSIYDELGRMDRQSETGDTLFLTLFYLLRGRDGTPEGEAAHQAYRDYRDLLLAFKDAYRKEPADVGEAEELKHRALSNWREHLWSLAGAYVAGQRRLREDFLITADMLEGFGLSVTPLRILAPRLQLRHSGDRVTVSWQGEARLQQAPTVAGPWSDVDQTSPVEMETSANARFFRTVAAPDKD
jgi:hypothetical protein